MRVWISEHRVWGSANWWVDFGFVDVPDTPGSHNVRLPNFLGQSDRIPSVPLGSGNEWAYHTGLYCSITVNYSIDYSNNRINATINNFNNWHFYRQKGSTLSGRSCVRGNYTWYSSFNSSIYHYVGPTTSGQANQDVSFNGGSSTFTFSNVAPGTRSNSHQFAWMKNNVNGNLSYAFLQIENTLPPDYRPGERKIGGRWMSLDRSGGVCERNNSWYEMKTKNGNSGGTGDPPEVKRSGSWYNQNRIGEG